jgi:hypothetical protein
MKTGFFRLVCMAENLPQSPIIPPVPTSDMTNPILSSPEPSRPVVPSPPPASGGSSKKGLLVTGVIALSAIVILGVLAFSIQNSTKEATTPSQAVSTPTPTQAPKSLIMEVSNLNDNEVTKESILRLTGNTNVPATVTITGGKEDMVIESTGTFSANVALTEGENQLTFTAIDTNDNQKVLTWNIFYTTEETN